MEVLAAVQEPQQRVGVGVCMGGGEDNNDED